MLLNIVIPCYNEEAVLHETNRQLTSLVTEWIEKGVLDGCLLVYVDDGSNDRTWEIIEELGQNFPGVVRGLKLAHNVGHQNALWGGLMWSVGKCDAVVTVDADLQQDIRKIEDMVQAYREGYEIVYGVRNDRATDSIFKKKTALAFYALMRKMGVDVIPNHADYRLLGSKALSALAQYPERNLFLRGMVRSLGFRGTTVYFDCGDRIAGESKYTLGKMFNFAMDGITSFSVQPLRVITLLGVFVIILSLFASLYAIIVFLCGKTIQGWTSILLSIWFLGGTQLLCIGVLGEYIGKNYVEVKRRPRYIIEKEV